MAVPGGAVAGIVAGYLLLFPSSRVLVLVPSVIGVECVDIPAWVVAGLWVVVHGAVASTSGAGGSGTALAMAWCAGALAGGVTVRAFRRRERMRVDWWDLPRT
jgi:membrane associated rhomboid family serine protease